MRSLSAVRACWRLATSQMTGSSNRLSAARRWRSLLRRPTPRTTSETHAWLTALEQQAQEQSHQPALCSGSLHSSRKLWRSRTLARVLRRPDSRDVELALGEAMTAV
jgi:hypothetical protein